ncbi:MAG: type I-E CRISPR-associated protein Cas5/CasD [Candidatus Tectomicrobia bacterium]|nr:type I-E CRISPR-associated protein Cas5/CasD [Candidatus Tectomicrobia bacterium]
MMRHLILNLESPLMSFGGETIDNLGVIRWFPAASMLTGLFANALGWRRTERQQHQLLQDRLIFAARIDREPAGGVRATDFQTAKLGAGDKGWTTRGRPEGRAGGANTYDAPHLRYRDYFADMRVTVALRLQPEVETPTLDDLANALHEPKRPLFIGRKPCLPVTSLFRNFMDGDTALGALIDTALDDPDSAPDSVKLLWPRGEGVEGIIPNHVYMLTDQRNWVSGLHGGGRQVCEGTEKRDRFGNPTEAPPERSKTQ